MKNIKTIIASVIVPAIVVVIGFLVYHPAQKVVITKSPEVKGASADFSNSPVLNVNGINEWYVTQPMKAGTSTVCSIPNPLVSYGGASTTMYQASTTMVYFSIHQNTATSVQLIYDMGTSTNPQGTSSALISNFIVPANATSTAFGWMPTSWTQGLVGSAQNVNVVASAVNAASLGFCQAEFTQF